MDIQIKKQVIIKASITVVVLIVLFSFALWVQNLNSKVSDLQSKINKIGEIEKATAQNTNNVTQIVNFLNEQIKAAQAKLTPTK